MAEKVTEILSHWYHLIEGLQVSSKAFYTAVEQAIDRRVSGHGGRGRREGKGWLVKWATIES
jgi:hypothetical protein